MWSYLVSSLSVNSPEVHCLRHVDGRLLECTRLGETSSERNLYFRSHDWNYIPPVFSLHYPWVSPENIIILSLGRTKFLTGFGCLILFTLLITLRSHYFYTWTYSVDLLFVLSSSLSRFPTPPSRFLPVFLPATSAGSCLSPIPRQESSCGDPATPWSRPTRPEPRPGTPRLPDSPS